MGSTRDSEPIEESKEDKASRLKSQKTITKKELNQIKRDREIAKLIYPNQVDELQQYWNTPRRIRLTGKTEQGICNCCGKEALIRKSYLSKNYGCNYAVTPRRPVYWRKEFRERYYIVTKGCPHEKSRARSTRQVFSDFSRT
jgi:hypothetical protein